MSNAFEPERDTLAWLRADFESKGYEFLTHPNSALLPEFLSGHSPDAIALGPNDKVVIEVKQSGSPEGSIRLAQLVQKIPVGSGWRHLLVYAGQDPSEVIDLPRPNQSQVDGAIKEARRLEQLGYTRPAMLEAWSILEALARRLQPQEVRLSLRPQTPMQVVERLAMDGEIDAEQARRLRMLSPLRNAAVHGDLDVKISDSDVGYILDVIENISNQPAT